MCLRSSTDPQPFPLFSCFLFFLPPLRPPSSQPPCALTDSDRCVCVRAARCIHQPKPESYRCSGVPNKLSQLTRRCHQCELEKRWICSIPQRCYFDTHALHMLSGDQQADFEKEKTADGGVKNWRESRNFPNVCLLVHTVSLCSLSKWLWLLRRRVSHKCQAGC